LFVITSISLSMSSMLTVPPLILLSSFFVKRHARDVVFVAGRVIEGPIELRLSEWELDEFGDMAVIPYHIRLCIEGIP
jgi:hypothetical protein